MSWTVAPSVAAMFTQADNVWPGRDKGSDGTIGDASHQQHASDHNPENGVVHAGDLTAVLQNGLFTPNGDSVVARVVANRDPRVAYLIWDRHIWWAVPHKGYEAWQPQPYSGASPHTEHVHISIWSELNMGQAGFGVDRNRIIAAEHDTRPWWNLVVPVVEEDDMQSSVLRNVGDYDAYVGLGRAGVLKVQSTDAAGSSLVFVLFTPNADNHQFWYVPGQRVDGYKEKNFSVSSDVTGIKVALESGAPAAVVYQ